MQQLQKALEDLIKALKQIEITPYRYHPVTIINTYYISDITFNDAINTQISKDAKKVVLFAFSIEPDPNAEYQVTIGEMLRDITFQSSSIVTINLPLNEDGYDVLQPESIIRLRIRSLQSGLTTKTSYIISWVEAR